MPVNSFNISDLLSAVVNKIPDRTAIICGDHRCTYQELDQGANRAAHGLLAQGIKAGDHVGFYLYNSIAHVEAMLACFKIGAVPVNVNFRYASDELFYLLDNADIKVCFVSTSLLDNLNDVAPRCEQLKISIAIDDQPGDDASQAKSPASFVYGDFLAAQSREANFEQRSDKDQIIIYTGGTTGMPKGVMWPHKEFFMGCLMGGGLMTGKEPCKTPDDITEQVAEFPLILMALAPLIHGACLWTTWIQLLAGCTLVFNASRSFDGAQIWSIVEQEKVNILSITGDAMAHPLIDALEKNAEQWQLDSLFSVASGGAVFSKAKQMAFKQFLPNLMISNTIGSSEGGQFASLAEGEGLGHFQRSETLDVIVEDDDGQRRLADDGEHGILSRAGHMPIGYYGDQAKTDKTFVNVAGKRWLLSGDAACRYSDGKIEVFGRGSNCINSGGEKIFPEEVEMALKANASIIDALVVGVDDDRWGSAVNAVISTRDNQTLALDEVKQEAKALLSSYKLPRAIHIVESVPRMPNGKPDYRAALEIAKNAQTVESSAV